MVRISGSTVIYKTMPPSAIECDDGLRFSQNPMKQGVSTNKIIIIPSVNTNGKQINLGDYTLTIHTQHGNQVYHKTQRTTQFDISALKKGFYIARLRTKKGNIVSEKFIIED